MNFSLRCHLCQTAFPATALWVCDKCLGPLEVTYDYDAIAKTLSRELIESRAEEPLALSRAAADRRRAAHRPALRLHAAREGRPAGGAARRPRALRQGRLGQPSDLFVQGPRRLGRRDARRRARASPCSPARRRATSPAASPRTPRASASPAPSSSPTTSKPARSPAPASTARSIIAVRGNYDDVNRLCTQVADQVRLGLREHQPARLLRRRRQDLRLRDRRAARLAFPAARRLAGGRRHAAAAHPQGLRGAAHRRPGRRRAAGDLRGAGGRLRAGGARARRRASSSPIRSSRTRSPSRSRSAIRPTASRCCASVRATGGAGAMVERRRDHRGHPAARRDRRHLHRAGRRRHRRGDASSSSSAALIPRDESIVICITGNGYKTVEVLNGQGVEPIRIGAVAGRLRSEPGRAGVGRRGERLSRTSERP